jgi:hypothetical protein
VIKDDAMPCTDSCVHQSQRPECWLRVHMVKPQSRARAQVCDRRGSICCCVPTRTPPPGQWPGEPFERRDRGICTVHVSSPQKTAASDRTSLGEGGEGESEAPRGCIHTKRTPSPPSVPNFLSKYSAIYAVYPFPPRFSQGTGVLPCGRLFFLEFFLAADSCVLTVTD